MFENEYQFYCNSCVAKMIKEDHGLKYEYDYD